MVAHAESHLFHVHFEQRDFHLVLRATRRFGPSPDFLDDGRSDLGEASGMVAMAQRLS